MNIAVCLFAFAMLLGFTPLGNAQETNTPTYHGRTAENWALELTRGKQSDHVWFDLPEDAFEAFCEIGATAVPVLVEKLDGKDMMVRYNSAKALKLMGIEARDALPALMRALDDEDEEVRGIACDAVGALRIEAYPAMARLEELLADKRHTTYPPHCIWYLRDRACEALVSIHVDALPGLMKGSRSSSVETRMTCIPALGEFPEEAAVVVPLLVESLDDREPLIRSLAATSLQKLEQSARSATAALAKHLDDAGEYGIGFSGVGTVGDAAIAALRQIGPTEKELPTLVRRMQRNGKPADTQGDIVPNQERDLDSVGAICAMMIGTIGPPARRALPELRAALKNDQLRTPAASSILLIDPDDLDARNTFFESAHNPHDALLVVDTIRRLGWHDDETTKLLHEMLTETEGRVRIVAAGLLLRTSPEMKEAERAFCEGFGDHFDGIRQSYECIDRDWSAVLSILREIPAAMKLALPIAVESLSEKYLRDGACEALIAMSVHRDIPCTELLDRLEAERLELRVNAVRALGLLRRGSGEIISRLVTKLDDSAPVLRAEAAKALGNIGKADGPLVDALIRRLKDEYATVRVNAANALAQLGLSAKSAKPDLVALSRDESKPVRDAAAHAIAAIEK